MSRMEQECAQMTRKSKTNSLECKKECDGGMMCTNDSKEQDLWKAFKEQNGTRMPKE